MSDASDGGNSAQTDGQEVDPLSQAASGIEAPKFPLLQDNRIVRFEVVAITKAPVKDKPDREVLTVKMRTVKDQVDTDSKPLRAGFTCFTRTGITPFPEEGDKRARTNKEIAAELGMLLKGAGKGDKSPRELLNNLDMLNGQLIDFKVSLQPEKNGYPASNSFKVVLPA